MAPASKFTHETEQTITGLIGNGVTVAVAAEAAGVARSTVYRWMGRPRDFRVAVERARAEMEVSMVASVERASRAGSWRASAWLLERMAPERWAKPSDRPTPGGGTPDGRPITAPGKASARNVYGSGGPQRARKWKNVEGTNRWPRTRSGGTSTRTSSTSAR
jgi:hypothetical protein